MSSTSYVWKFDKLFTTFSNQAIVVVIWPVSVDAVNFDEILIAVLQYQVRAEYP